MKVGIVGAGITGLSLLHELTERGVDAVVYEAADTPGGVIRTEHRSGRVLDWGPQRVRLTPDVRELIEAVGIEDEVIEADPALPVFVYRDGELGRLPLSVWGLFATDLLSWRGKLRVFAEPFTGAGRPEESVAELFSRKFGREAYERAIGPAVGGMYASDPAEMPAGYVLSGLIDSERRSGSLLRAALGSRGSRGPPATFQGGMARLPEAIAAAYRDRVKLGTPVTAIRAVGNGVSVQLDRGSVGFDAVVVTAPAPAAAELLAGIAPDAADRLQRLTYQPLAVVHLDSSYDRPGMGYQVAQSTPLHTLGVTWKASLFGRDGDASTGYEGVFTCFLGGGRDPGILERDDAELGTLAAREFEEVTGADADVLAVTRLGPVMPAYDRTWEALDGLELPPGVHLAANYDGRLGIPGRLRQATQLSESLA